MDIHWAWNQPQDHAGWPAAFIVKVSTQYGFTTAGTSFVVLMSSSLAAV